MTQQDDYGFIYLKESNSVSKVKKALRKPKGRAEENDLHEAHRIARCSVNAARSGRSSPFAVFALLISARKG